METAFDSVRYLQQAIEPTRQLLLNNGLYYRLRTLSDLQHFMEHHVFAVWDFALLLKALQRELAFVQVPWMTTANPATRRLINEMVLAEGGDVDLEGQPASHFELYVRAMAECGADTAPIRRFVAAITAGQPVAYALTIADVPDSVRQFVETTFGIINSGQSHAVAAAFSFGREDLIPAIFQQLGGSLRQQYPGKLDALMYYLDRHPALEEKMSIPLAQQIMREFCGDNPECWQQAQQTVIQCLEAHMALWDGIKPVKVSLALA